MIDTGWYTPDSLEGLQEGLTDLGLQFTDIETMIVTHVHPDHFGLAGKIKQLSPHTTLLAHKWEWALIESRYINFTDLQRRMGQLLHRHGVPDDSLPEMEAASLPVLDFATITMPDGPLYGGETIDTGRYRLEIIWTPGHSPGHICIYEPENRLLFTGDHLFPKITPNVSFHVQSGDNPLGDFLYSLHKLENLPVSKVLPAHEYAFEGLRERIGELDLHHENRKAEMHLLIQDRPHTAYDIAARITWDIPDLSWNEYPAQLQRIAITETIAHLELMRWEGTIERLEMNGLIQYRTRG